MYHFSVICYSVENFPFGTAAIYPQNIMLIITLQLLF